MGDLGYLMESAEEALRLELKTDRETVARHASWAGLGPGMRVADLGCGSGAATSVLGEVAGPGGQVLGVDISEQRVAYARERYGGPRAAFEVGDIRQPLERFGTFDFVWIRFVLEYYLRGAFEIVENAMRVLRPGGVLCLIDLDHNALSHHEVPGRLGRTIAAALRELGPRANFDAYAGRKLYAHLFDLGIERIRVTVEGHHLIYGELRESDAFNWMKKVELVPRRLGLELAEYPGGHEEFVAEFETFFRDPRRFTYSPLIVAAGVRPADG